MPSYKARNSAMTHVYLDGRRLDILPDGSISGATDDDIRRLDAMGVLKTNPSVTLKLFQHPTATTALAVSTLGVERADFAYKVVGASISLNAPSTAGLPAIDIQKNGTTLFSTALTIDVNEKTSYTAATGYALKTDATILVAINDEIKTVCSTSGTGAQGVAVKLLVEPL